MRIVDGWSFQPQVPKERYQVYWQEIKLKPVSIVPNNRYWLVLDVERGEWSLVLAKDGQSTGVRVTNDKRWRTYNPAKTNVMIRFFGRVIPFTQVQN